MSPKENNFLQNFIETAVGTIVTNLAFLGFGLNISKIGPDLLKFVGIIIGLIILIVIVKKIFKNFDVGGFFDGLWIGTSLFCFAPLTTLPWLTDTLNASKASIIYIVAGLVVLWIGYCHNKKRK